MRIVFIGSPPFARESFERILGRKQAPVGLVTAPGRKAGRGRSPAPNSLAELARGRNIPVLQPEKASDPSFLDAFAELRPDLGVVVSYGQILRPRFLETPALGCINLHGSLLPRWRGASPVQAAILAGDACTGVSIQRVVQELDAGAVLDAVEIEIGPHEDAPALTARIAAAGARLLEAFLDRLGDGPLPAGVEQDPERVTHCRKVRKEQARIDWSASAAEVGRLVRAMAGWPVAETRRSGAERTGTIPSVETLKILAGEQAESGSGLPGTIVSAGGELVVACGSGAYRVDRLQRPGKAPMDAASFLRGARLQTGEVLT